MMIVRALAVTCVLASGALLSGCATVTRGLSEQIQINSDPPGASVQTSLSHACVTPCTLQVQRKDEFSVTVAKPGYEPQTVAVTTRIASAGVIGFGGNIILGGVVGMGVDASTGATLEHFPNPVTVSLVPLRAAPPGIPPPRGKGKQQPAVAARPPMIAPVAPVVASEPEPQLSEADRTMNSRQ